MDVQNNDLTKRIKKLYKSRYYFNSRIHIPDVSDPAYINVTHSPIIDSSIAIPEEGVPFYTFCPDLYLMEDSTLMDLPWKNPGVTTCLKVDEIDDSL